MILNWNQVQLSLQCTLLKAFLTCLCTILFYYRKHNLDLYAYADNKFIYEDRHSVGLWRESRTHHHLRMAGHLKRVLKNAWQKFSDWNNVYRNSRIIFKSSFFFLYICFSVWLFHCQDWTKYFGTFYNIVATFFFFSKNIFFVKNKTLVTGGA